jgi:hypothetical protein
MKTTIYGLIDPHTHRTRYVGRTNHTATKRFKEHIQEARRGNVRPVYDWIRSLLPRVPVLHVLEVIADGDGEVTLPDGKYENKGSAAETKWSKRFERSQLFNWIDRDSRAYRRLVNTFKV